MWGAKKVGGEEEEEAGGKRGDRRNLSSSRGRRRGGRPLYLKPKFLLQSKQCGEPSLPGGSVRTAGDRSLRGERSLQEPFPALWQLDSAGWQGGENVL